MGTTAEKLNYLKETKSQIKQALETPYNVFRDYPKLIKKYVDNQPTTKVIDGVCNNALDVSLKSCVICGNSEQKQYEGYNILINNSQLFPAFVGGININFNDNGSFAVKGTPTSTWNRKRNTGNIYNIKTGTYTLYVKVVGNCPSARLTVALEDAEMKTIVSGIVGVSNSSLVKVGTFNYDGTTEIAYTSIVLESFKTDSNYDCTFYPMLIKGTYTTNIPYEPYVGGQPSPNPEYPQEIEVVEGSNLFDVASWVEKGNNKDYYSFENGKLKIKALDSRSFQNFKEEEKVYLENGQYYLSGTGNSGIRIYNKGTDDNTSTNTFEVTLGYIYIKFVSSEVIEIQPQITLGTTPKPYLPHGCIGLEQSGKNKFDISVLNDYAIVNGSEFSFDKGILPQKVPKIYGFDNSKKYILSWKFKQFDSSVADNIRGVVLQTYNKDNKLITDLSSNVNRDGERKIEVTGLEYISFTYGNEGRNIIYDLQIEEVSEQQTEPTAYEPYHEPKIIPIDLQGNTLAKVGDIKDKLKIYRNGEVEIEKRVGDGILCGNDEEIYWKATNNKFALNIGSKKGALLKDLKTDNAKVSILSDKLKGVSWNVMNKNTVGWQISLRQDTDNTYLRLLTTNIETANELTNFLNNNNVKFKYPLAEPQIIKLPSISPIELWQGTNIFKLITNLETDFEIEYVINKDNILDEVQTAMLEAEIEI